MKRVNIYLYHNIREGLWTLSVWNADAVKDKLPTKSQSVQRGQNPLRIYTYCRTDLVLAIVLNV